MKLLRKITKVFLEILSVAFLVFVGYYFALNNRYLVILNIICWGILYFIKNDFDKLYWSERFEDEKAKNNIKVK